MEYKLGEMCSWERQKACFLIQTAEELGMDLDSYGEVALNQHSDYVYIWSENYNFSLFMPINCELKKDDVRILWTNSNNGQETEEKLGNKNLEDIENFVNECEVDLEK